MPIDRQARFFLNILLLVFVTFGLSQFIGFTGQGFDTASVIDTQNFYVVYGIFIIGIFAMFFIEKAISKGDKKYGDTVLFASPGKGLALPFFKKWTDFQIIYLFTFIFGILGLSFVFSQANKFLEFGRLEQQFTPIGEILYSITLVPGAEQAGFILFLGVAYIALRAISRKYDWSKANFRLWTIVSLIGVGLIYWVGNHLLRYQGSDLALIKVGMFGLIMVVITIATGTWIPAWIMHLMNNLFVMLREFFSNEAVLTATITILVLMGIGSYWVIYKPLIKKKREGG